MFHPISRQKLHFVCYNIDVSYDIQNYMTFWIVQNVRYIFYKSMRRASQSFRSLGSAWLFANLYMMKLIYYIFIIWNREFAKNFISTLSLKSESNYVCQSHYILFRKVLIHRNRFARSIEESKGINGEPRIDEFGTRR